LRDIGGEDFRLTMTIVRVKCVRRGNTFLDLQRMRGGIGFHTYLIATHHLQPLAEHFRARMLAIR